MERYPATLRALTSESLLIGRYHLNNKSLHTTVIHQTNLPVYSVCPSVLGTEQTEMAEQDVCSDLTFFIIFTTGVSVNIFSALDCFLLIIFHVLIPSWVNTFASVLLEQYPLSGCVINRQAVYVCSVVISSCYHLLSSCSTHTKTSAARMSDMTQEAGALSTKTE